MGKTRSTIIRTTISLPRELKARMDKAKELINWSALACQAFEDKLGEIAARKEKKTQMSAIERLRASKRKTDSAEYRAGREDGVKWAMNRAEAFELQRLEELRAEIEDSPNCDWEEYFTDDSQTYSAAERLYFSVHPEHEGNRDVAKWFWDKAIGDDDQADRNRDSGVFLRGFADGAIDFWLEVKDKI